ncbi:MAG: hypothetical protein HeimC3_08820 [Candidatus Heimdallarchaeota archaeon LC_3]|nr:MAG: hypothetical protein HeimC3_08820 [Candidatus Heimdallarchaeota archaeon LC_3]
MSNTIQRNSEYEVTNPSVFELIFLGGVLGGIGGGFAFSLLILLLTPGSGFYTAVAGLFLPSSDVLVGFVVHIGIAVVFGIMFGIGLIFIPKLGSSQMMTLISGLVWALILWIIAAHILMPLIVFEFSSEIISSTFSLDYLISTDTWLSQNSVNSLLTHLLYGVLLALVTWNLPPLLEKIRSR